MKVGLKYGETIEGKFYPPGCVIDVFDKEALALIENGRAEAVKDGTMARMKSYGVPGCVPPAGFEIKAANTPAKSEEKQKTNILKK